MESIGEKLKTTREQRGYTLEQVARDTNIAKRFIVALEGEEFSLFPGDPYLIGFLRNYADYLGMDGEELVGLYRNLQLQEQPAPIEQLLDTKKRFRPLPFLIVLLLLLAVGGGGYLFLNGDFSQKSDKVSIPADKQDAVDEESPEAPKGQAGSFPLEEEIFERRFALNDTILISLASGDLLVRVSDVSESLELDTPAGIRSFSSGEERKVDLNGDGTQDLRISVYDILSSDSSAVIRFDRFLKRPDNDGGSSSLSGGDSDPSMGSFTAEGRKQDPVTILSADGVEPFSLQLEFRGYSLFRYLADGDQREERYFHKGEQFRLDVNRRVRLWVSNAGSLIARVNGQEIGLGSAGSVSAKQISWEKNSDGGFDLKLLPVY